MPEEASTNPAGATPTNDGKAPAAVPTPPKSDGDKPLGPNGEKALEAERTARKELERQIQALQATQTQQMAALASAFGIKAEGAKPDDVVSTLQEQVASMQHQALVDRIARTHGITDDGDIEILSSTTDEKAMGRLAERLAAKASESAPGTPRPDLTQGGSGAPPALNSSALEEALKSKLGIA